MLTKVLITVKTYPDFLSNPEEVPTICGFKEDGSWVRIYPFPLKKMPFDKQFKKYDWIEIDLIKNMDDFRPESYLPVNPDLPIKVVGHLDTENCWHERRKIVLNKVYNDFNEIITDSQNKENPVSLAVYQPKKSIQFESSTTISEWNSTQRYLLEKYNLYDDGGDDLVLIPKIPFKFYYYFEDYSGGKIKLAINDWEVSKFYLTCLRKYEGNESKAYDYLRRKFFDDYAKAKDAYFFMSTTLQSHHKPKIPFSVVGVFYPKFQHEISFF